ncbi:MAG: plastocyanin/azurin family copper-binding protein [Dehalococcoidia bacterium]
MRKVVIGIALVAGLLFAGCGGVDVPDHPDPLGHRPETTHELRVQARAATFIPAELTVKVGATTQLTFENVDEAEHDFQIDQIDVDVMEGEVEHEAGHESGDLVVHTQGGETDTITFVINEPGTYDFYCTLPGHKDAGMAGTLEATS